MKIEHLPDPAASSDSGLERLNAVIERITYHNAENGWSVVRVTLMDDPTRLLTVLLHQARVFAGATFEFWGSYVKHPQHGLQFRAVKAIEQKPASIAALEKYLGSGLIKGVGPVMARRIVNHFKDKTLEVFDGQINRLKTVPGIAEKKLSMIKSSWEEHRSIRDVMIFLQGHGLSTLFATKIFKTYGDQAIQIVNQNPYRLAQDVFGIGFFSADRLALALGFDPRGSLRIEAAIQQVLNESRNEGHCYLTESQIIKLTISLLKEPIANEQILSVIETLSAQDVIKLRRLTSNSGEIQSCYYAKVLYTDELVTAQQIFSRISVNVTIDRPRVESWVEKYCEQQEISLSTEQSQAVCKIVEHGFSCLTGGPGCGKTTTTRVLVKLLQAMQKKILLAAPTGRAAQRMTEVIGVEAKTIHRLLEWTPHLGGFARNEHQPLDADFLIVDETSMLDISLAAALLKALPQSMQVLFIGDPDQLPSVGAGDVLADLLKASQLPQFRLTKIFRQAEASSIIRFAHQINSGQMPKILSPIEQLGAFHQGHDCLFIDADEETKNHPGSSLRYGLSPVETLIRLYTKTLPEWLNQPHAEIQVLTPQLKGDMGTLNLNQCLQKASNPPSPHKPQILINDSILRQGDRVIQTRNNYDLGVFNGDIGAITMIDIKGSVVEVEFSGPERKKVIFKKEDLFDLSLAYAITIHKSQGSEFSAVILPVFAQHHHMLFRNLIYTGLTRAKKLTVFIGSRRALATAIGRTENRRRQTALAHLIGSAAGAETSKATP